jgi:hypothetical protein
MGWKRKLLVTAATLAVVAATTTSTASAKRPAEGPVVRKAIPLATDDCAGGLGSGSTVGPDGALYVTDGNGGCVLRVDPRTGRVSTFATGLPTTNPDVGIGGPMDVAFIGHTAYVLVTLVAPGSSRTDPDLVDGIYRVNKKGPPTLVAHLGEWSIENPPKTPFDIPSGVQYALQTFRGGFLVTDGHHNRVLRVRLDDEEEGLGDIEELIGFTDIVPTGLEVRGNTVYLAQAGPIPHDPDTGRVVAFRGKSPDPADTTVVASGASLLVDVELGPDHTLYALSQGLWTLDPTDPKNAGKPASPGTGVLVRVDGTSLTPVVPGLDRPTSLELIGDTAFVVTLTGTLVRIDDVPGSPHGTSH